MKYLEKQRDNPENVTEKDFMAHPNILETQNILLFFKDNKLKPDAKEIYGDFQQWQQEINKLAQSSKNYKSMKKEQQEIIKLKESIQTSMSQ